LSFFALSLTVVLGLRRTVACFTNLPANRAAPALPRRSLAAGHVVLLTARHPGGCHSDPSSMLASTMATDRRTCVFCGSAPVTAEHALPQWMSKVVPGNGRFTHLQIKPARTARRTPMIDIRVRVVCSNCNSGWMSQLETSSMNVLSPMIRGEVTTLSIDEQKTVAAWAVKTAIVLQATGPARDIPGSHARRLRERGEAPPGVAVAVGHYVGTMSAMYGGTRLHILPEEGRDHDLPSRRDPRFGYRATICVGHLAIQAYQFETTQFVDPDFGIPRVPPFLSIWPAPRSVVRWPPPLALDDRALRALVERAA
jgi:hypothetical protein